MITLVRAVAVWLALAVVTLGLGRAAAAGWPGSVGRATFPDLLVAVAVVALAGCAAWVWLVATVVLGEALTAARAGGPRTTALSRGMAPAWLRRAIVVGCGLALVGAGPAVAADVSSSTGGHGTARFDSSTTHQPVGVDAETVARWRAQHEVTQRRMAMRAAHRRAARPDQPDRHELEGLPMPDRPLGGPGSRVRPSRRQVPSEVVVRPGDSLWDLARTRPGLRDDADIARQTAALYAANRSAIGPDPDVIHPGLRLRLPPLPHHH